MGRSPTAIRQRFALAIRQSRMPRLRHMRHSPEGQIARTSATGTQSVRAFVRPVVLKDTPSDKATGDWSISCGEPNRLTLRQALESFASRLPKEVRQSFALASLSRGWLSDCPRQSANRAIAGAIRQPTSFGSPTTLRVGEPLQRLAVEVP